MSIAQGDPSRELYDKLRWHIGHEIEMYGLGPPDQIDPQQIVVECKMCRKILVEAKRAEKR